MKRKSVVVEDKTEEANISDKGEGIREEVKDHNVQSLRLETIQKMIVEHLNEVANNEVQNRENKKKAFKAEENENTLSLMNRVIEAVITESDICE